MTIEIDAKDLPRVMACNGSVIMPAAPKFEEETTTSSRAEGVAAQYMAKAVFEGQHSQSYELIDRKAPNGVYMNYEMAENVNAFLDVFQRHSAICISASMEHTTDNWIASVLVKGRANYISFSSLGTLNVIDFRYGYGIVEPEDNWTLLFHAISWIISNQTQPQRIVLSVFQPRPYHADGSLREWPLTYPEIMEKYRVLQETLGNLSNTLNSGPQCTNCPANALCPAARKANMNCIDVSDTVFKDDLPNEAISQELKLIIEMEARTKARKDALSELAKFRIKSGQVIEDFTLEATQGNREWPVWANADLLKTMTGQDLSKPGLISPAQAEKKGVPKDAVNAIAVRNSTGTKLVRESANKKASRLFGTTKTRSRAT